VRSFETTLLHHLSIRRQVRIDYHPNLATAVTDWRVTYPLGYIRRHLAALEYRGVIEVRYRRGWFWRPRPHVIVRWAA